MQWVFFSLCLVLFAVKPGYTQGDEDYPDYPDYDDDPCADGGITLTETSGVIEPASNPYPYENLLDCNWRIEAPAGKRIAVKFSPQFSVEVSSDGTCVDFVSFDDGKEILKMCGKETPNSYLSSSNILDVNFFTNENETGDSGFSFNWTAIESTTIPSPVANTISNDQGTLSSPGFPSGYGNFESYTWTLTVDANKYIVVEFDDTFEVETGGTGDCPYDSLTIFEGASQINTLMKLCTKPSSSIVLKTNEIVIKFTSDSTVTGLGFSLQYKAVDPVSCEAPKLMSGAAGVVTSPYYPVSYEDNLNCQWQIVVEAHQRIAIRFNEPFDIKYQDSCTSDRLQIFDGASTTSTQFLEDFCGNYQPRGFLSSAHQLTIIFASGELEGNAPGFSLNWTAEVACGTALFQCWDGTCIDEALKCDGNVDCPSDIADESECAGKPSEDGCGIQEIPPEFYWEHRIVGGSEAIQGSWPWQVGIFSGGNLYCGGVLITTSWVLTAAHCVLKGSDITAILGDYNITDSNTNQEQRILVDQIFVHPSYADNMAQGYLNGSDVALFHLSSPATKTTWVQTICFPSVAPGIAETVVTTGWGRTSLTSLNQPEVLRQVRISVLSASQCSKTFSSLSPTALPDGVLCASGPGPGMGACQGDSGGPAMGLRDGNWEVVGIVSFSHKCGVEGLPTYFTDVSSYLDFITKYSQHETPKREKKSIVMNQETGTLTLPALGDETYPNYPQNVLLQWFINVPEDKTITVRFSDSFNIEFGGQNCPYDSLILYDGHDTSAPIYLNKKFCGSLAPPDFESTSNSIIVEFSSDGAYEESGFSIQWYTMDNCAENQFRCWNQTCIPLDEKCDGNFNCLDGADEIPCKLPVGFECGVPEVQPTIPWYPLIVGGHDATEGSWPWQVGIFDDSRNFVCGGTLIGSRWVLTAAQCISRSKSYTVSLGDYNLDYISLNERGVVVKDERPHSDYKEVGSNDIAMLELDEDAPYSKWIKPICLPELNDKNPVAGTTCMLTGWGVTAEASEESTYRILQQVPLTVFSDSECIDTYKKVYHTYPFKTLPEHLICAGHQQKRANACLRDTGGPLQCLVDGAWRQYGIASFGPACGDHMFFERVSYYKNWMDENIARQQCEERTIEEGESGFVQAPTIDGKYPTNMDCSWLIRAPEGKILEITFEYFDVEYNAFCKFDNFTMYDGNNEKSRKFLDETLCGLDRAMPQLVSTGNEILIAFKSDESESYRGFKLSYTAIDGCSENQFRCWDNSCIDREKRCDGVADCPHERDEIECPHPVGICGVQYVAPDITWNSRIYGGSHAVKGSWPWQVYIIGDGTYQCGAALVHEEWVLTAAHCTYFRYSLYVGFGGHNLTDNENDIIIRVDTSSGVYRHEKYVPGSIEDGYDIALLKLTTKINFTEYIQPICMATPEVKSISPEANCFVTGWGRTQYNGGVSQVLRQVHVPIMTDGQCEKANEEPYNEEILFCSGDFDTGGADSCQGDSGGPLVCFENNHWYQYGIVSYGSDGAYCGRPGQAGFYTRISYYESWIQNITNRALPIVPPEVTTTESPSTTTQEQSTDTKAASTTLSSVTTLVNETTTTATTVQDTTGSATAVKPGNNVPSLVFFSIFYYYYLTTPR